jgi:hypothetical protein
MTATYSLSLLPESNPAAATKAVLIFLRNKNIRFPFPRLNRMSLPSNIENKEGKENGRTVYQ